MIDFTLEKYKLLCSVLLEKGYRTVTVSDYIKTSGSGIQKCAVLRHDVDRKAGNALKMAELEYRLGVHSTYYFRYPYTFKPLIMRLVEDLGHEVGYHYEVLSKARGDYPAAIRMFAEELQAFNSICEVKSICMHGSPLSPYDNRDLWRVYQLDEYNLVGEAYLSVGKDFSYYSDTGRSWSPRNKIRDCFTGKEEAKVVETTDELIDAIRCGQFGNLYLLVHPERWAETFPEWAASSLQDQVFNMAKNLINLARQGLAGCFSFNGGGG